MKNRLTAISILALLLVTLSGCGGETTVSAPPESSASHEETAEPTVIDYDNRALCGNELVDVALKDIHQDGITLTITSKTSEILTLDCDGLAFDGQSVYHGNISYLHEELVPNTSVEVEVACDIGNNIKHQTLSGQFNLLKYDEDGGGNSIALLPFSIDLGYEANSIWNYPTDTDPQSGQVLYEDDRFTLRFYRIMDSTFALTLENKTSEYYSATFSSFVANGKSLDNTRVVWADALPGCTSIFSTEFTDLDLESELSAGSTVSGIVQLFGSDHSGAGQLSFNMTIE